MTRLQTLNTLLEREEGLRDEARAAYAKAVEQAEAAKAQAESLHNYRDEYRQRWAAQFAQGGHIEIVRCYQGFVDRLDQAITQAHGTARLFDGQLQRARERMQAAEIRVATVQRLIERTLQAAAQAVARRDQKNMDELAQRRRPGAPILGFA